MKQDVSVEIIKTVDDRQENILYCFFSRMSQKIIEKNKKYNGTNHLGFITKERAKKILFE